MNGFSSIYNIPLRLFSLPEKILAVALCLIFMFPFDFIAAAQNEKVADAITLQQEESATEPGLQRESVSLDEEPTDKNSEIQHPTDETAIVATTDSTATDSVSNVVTFDDMPAGFSERKVFNPNPSRAVWLSALFPGLGQVYNRRYWKIPIIIGGFMGLGYATSWNNNQLQDYTQAYRDLTDSDPATTSYMNFFPPNTSESDFDKSWLEATMKSRKDYYRRNRDLCIICLVGLYLLCMVDAYVDASLAHFDISDDLSLDVQPAMFTTPVDNRVALGLNWAFNF